jgi:hypothetical protein
MRYLLLEMRALCRVWVEENHPCHLGFCQWGPVGSDCKYSLPSLRPNSRRYQNLSPSVLSLACS